MTKRTINSWMWVILIIVVGAGLIIWGTYSAKKKEGSLTSRQVALTCTTDMATEFHIHPTLAIMVNGENVPIPSNIGIQANCMTSLHTHDAVGTIHVEAPIQRDFTLGDFFAVWGKEFNKDHLLDYKVDGTKTITVTVNGTTVDTYENTTLRDKDKIIISYQ